MSTLWQVPVVVAAMLAWLSTPPASLADAAEREAMRRQLSGKATAVYTNLTLPVPAADASTGAGRSDASQGVAASTEGAGTSAQVAVDGLAPSVEVRNEAWWRGRVAALRASAERGDVLLKATQARINGLTAEIVSRDDPFQRQELRDQLQKALAEFDRLQMSVVAARQGFEQLLDEARRSGVPPGWLR